MVRHLVFFFYILSLLSGAASISMVLVYVHFSRTKDRIVVPYLVMYTLLSLKVVSWIVQAYTQGLELGFPRFLYYSLVEFPVYAILWAFPVCIHSFFDVPFRRILNLFFALLACAFTADDVFRLATGRSPDDSNLGTIVFGSVLLTVIIYSIVIGFIYLPRLVIPLRKRIAPAVLLLVVLFLPGLVIDSLPVVASPFVMSSLFYLVWNVAATVFVVRLLSTASSRIPIDPHAMERFDLSKREIEVIERLARGLSYQEIADELFVSFATAKTHVHNIYFKTGVRNRHALFALLRRYQSD